jgi:hypothetical protein
MKPTTTYSEAKAILVVENKNCASLNGRVGAVLINNSGSLQKGDSDANPILN